MKKNNIKIYRLITNLLGKKEKYRLLKIVVINMLMSLVQAVGIGSVAPFLLLVTQPSILDTNKILIHARPYFGDPPKPIYFLYISAFCFIVFVLTAFMPVASNWINTRFIYQNNVSLSKTLLLHYLGKPYAFFLNIHSASVLQNILNIVLSFCRDVLNQIIVLISQVTLIVCLLPVVLFANWKVGSFMIGSISLLYGISYLLIRKRVSEIGREIQRNSLFQNKGLIEIMGGIKEIIIGHKESCFRQEFGKLVEKNADLYVRTGVLQAMPPILLQTLMISGLFAMGIYTFLHQEKLAENTTLVALYGLVLLRVSPALNAAFYSAAKIAGGLSSAESLFEALQDKANSSEQNPIKNEKNPLIFRNHIILKDVSFRYENAKDLAIKGISLTIKRGSLVAVVGASGSGKSTLIDIICGLLQPCSGNISIDKTKITGRTMMAWQQKIGYVGQNIFVLDDTISNNIAFGVPSSEIDINQVKFAAEQAELADLIERQMPNQYLTKIGERGAKISGGQRQRIGLARAFYKKPDLLILDEATSALDRKTEKIILNRIKNYVELGMTVIKIAHRLPDLEHFDQVVEIKNGKISVKQKNRQMGCQKINANL